MLLIVSEAGGLAIGGGRGLVLLVNAEYNPLLLAPCRVSRAIDPPRSSAAKAGFPSKVAMAAIDSFFLSVARSSSNRVGVECRISPVSCDFDLGVLDLGPGITCPPSALAIFGR